MGNWLGYLTRFPDVSIIVTVMQYRKLPHAARGRKLRKGDGSAICARERLLGEKSFVVPVGESDCDRYRLYCVTERGRVAVLRVQFGAFIYV